MEHHKKNAGYCHKEVNYLLAKKHVLEGGTPRLEIRTCVYGYCNYLHYENEDVVVVGSSV